MFPLNLYARVRFSLCSLHTRPRVQRTPGLPCALYFFGGNEVDANLGHLMQREYGRASSEVFDDEWKSHHVMLCKFINSLIERGGF